mmetsp:Transcript_54297/g.126428  ORF Transcript_54297/g.126428 Transcript_54297/m.126428 type:complete len:394 (+) Transcript_54297:41-1222(+)
MMERTFGRSPTFLVGTASQRQNLDNLQRREEHLAEEYNKNKPLCFSAGAYQKTHPQKAQTGHRDADATVVSPMILGVADGVSQVEEFGIDSSELPNELLQACECVANAQLVPDRQGCLEGSYRGPIPLMKEAYRATESMGSTTIALAVLDNSTRIHGKLHPMVAVLSIGDCEVLVLRQDHSTGELGVVFHTEMQRIDGHAQCPLQLCRIDDRVDPDFDDRIPYEIIERGSAVHCVSVYEGDIVVIGSDGVFDNLFLDEVVSTCSSMIPPKSYGKNFEPTDPALLGQVARRVVELCHAKTQAGPGGHYADTPIGKGGKRDDTSCVVGEVVEWTEQHSEAWARQRTKEQWQDLFTCGGIFRACCPDNKRALPLCQESGLSDDEDTEEGRLSCSVS